MPKLSGVAKAALVIGGILVVSVIVDGNKNTTGPSPPAPPATEVPRSPPQTTADASPVKSPTADSDTFKFDPQDDRDSQIVQGYIDATDVCLNGRAEALLLGGDRSRADMAKQAGDLCGPTLKRIMIEQKFVASEAQADAWVEVMAEKAVNRVLDQHGVMPE